MNNDKFEEFLKRTPVDRPPENVFKKLQERASWNKAPLSPREIKFPLKATIGLLLLIVALLFIMFSPQNSSQEKPVVTNSKPETKETIKKIESIEKPPVVVAEYKLDWAPESKIYGAISVNFFKNQPGFDVLSGKGEVFKIMNHDLIDI